MNKKLKIVLSIISIISVTTISAFIIRSPITLDKEFEKTKYVSIADIKNNISITKSVVEVKDLIKYLSDKEVRRYSIAPAIKGRGFSSELFDMIILFYETDLTIYIGHSKIYIEDSKWRYLFENQEVVKTYIIKYIDKLKND